MAYVAATGWDRMCKLTKSDSPLLSWVLEFEYVNEVAERASALAPNLAVPARAARHSSMSG
jgi:hypothetical protein